MSCQERLFRDLRERGMRVTPQRELVLSVLHDIEGHASAEESIDECRSAARS